MSSDLVDALKRLRMISGNTKLAEQIAAIGERVEVPVGHAIIREGEEATEVYLIVSGSFHIVVNGRTVGRRAATDHVGEMAAILPAQRRSASVVATEPSVAVRLSETQMEELGEEYPQIWRTFARELAHRVHQRNQASTAVNEKTRVLIVAPQEAGEIARTIGAAFANDPFEIVIWKEGVFHGSRYAIETLEGELDRADVAVAVAGANAASSHEHIIFELGFFLGRLGRHRTFLIEARDEEMELPKELAGINTITYSLHIGDGKDLAHALAPACNRLRKLIGELGPNR